MKIVPVKNSQNVYFKQNDVSSKTSVWLFTGTKFQGNNNKNNNKNTRTK